MRISEMTTDAVKSYLRTDENVQEDVLNEVMAAAKAYIFAQTGLTEPEADGCEDLHYAYMVLCQDFYDNRTMHPDTKYANSANRTVESILAQHRRNLL